MVTAESLTKNHSVYLVGSVSVLIYTTLNKRMNDNEIIIEIPRLMNKEPEALGKSDLTQAKFLFMVHNNINFTNFVPYSLFIFWALFLAKLSLPT